MIQSLHITKWRKAEQNGAGNGEEAARALKWSWNEVLAVITTVLWQIKSSRGKVLVEHCYQAKFSCRL